MYGKLRKPKDWVLPNRTGFTSWGYREFPPSAYEEGAGTGTGRFQFFPHQRLIRDLFQITSPYRGILLYHGLGTGKSCSAIAAAEGFLSAGRKTFVMLPASIKSNFHGQIRKCAAAASPYLMRWTAVKVGAKPAKELTDQIRAQHSLQTRAITRLAKANDGVVWLPIMPSQTPIGSSTRAVPWSEVSNENRVHAYATIDAIIEAKFQFIHYNGLNETGFRALGTNPFDDAFVVIDEAHNFISRVNNGSKVSRLLYEAMLKAKNLKLVMLSGTPIINHPFELCVMLNLARGPMHIEEYQLLKSAAKELPTPDDVMEALGDALAQRVDTVQVSAKDQKIQITLLPWGFSKSQDSSGVVKNQWQGQSVKATYDAIKTKLARAFPIAKTTTFKEAYALPTTQEEFGRLFLDETTDPMNPVVMNKDLFLRRIQGLVSYFHTAGEELFPARLADMKVKVPLSDFQYGKYVKVREKEESMKKKSRFAAAMAGPAGVMNEGGKVYRAFSRMACNFVFPDDIKRDFPGDIRKDMARELTFADADAEAETETTDPVEPPVPGPDEAGPSNWASRGGAPKPAAPKAPAMDKAKCAELRANPTVNPLTGRTIKPTAATYKELMKQCAELERQAGPSRPRRVATPPPRPAPAPAPSAAIDEEVAAKKRATAAKKRYEDKLADIMHLLRTERKDILSKKQLADSYSPKFARIITDIEESPGTCLCYSQFRTMEGLGILTASLEQAGYAEIQIVREPRTGTWTIKDADRVLSADFDNRRFLVFDENREKTEILINLFNGNWKALPPSVSQVLMQSPTMAAQATAGETADLYGRVAKVLFITQSGAEGISLRNVRRVLITEPFWNKVRVDQVIGRAFRTGSHLALPSADRNVQVFIYMATLTPAQLRANFTLQRLDNSMTSDEHIWDLAEKKDKVIRSFLEMLKVASVDCLFNAKANGIAAKGLKCYTFPLQVAGPDSDALAYVPLLEADAEQPPVRRWAPEQTEQVRRVQGRVVQHQGVRKVVVDGLDGFFDYDSYKYAGALVRL